MIRFIIKRRQDNSYDCVSSNFETIDAECPELEQALTRGGKMVGSPGYDISELVGVRVLPKAKEQGHE